MSTSLADIAATSPGGSALSPAEIFAKTRAREETLSRLLMAFVTSGIFFMLFPGTFLGVWNLLQISGRESVASTSPAWLQAHGHAQVFGWVGSFILGIGFYSIPKLRGEGKTSFRAAWFCWATWTSEALQKLEFLGVVDFLMSETAHHADVVLAGSLQEEEEGIGCTAEGRVIHIQKAVDPPGNAKADSWIYCEIAKRLGKEKFFPYGSTREIYDELREASRGGHADYYGITYEKIDQNMGVFWPCPTLDHPGTPRLFEDGRSLHPDGKHRFVVTEWRESGDPVSPEFPVYLTTGRVISQYLSGTQTRRIGGLLDQYPNPRMEIHPRLAEQYGIKDGDWVTATSRRSAVTLQAMVVKTIRPDTVFIPYHWPGRRSANLLTHRTLDPRSKIPEFKVSACQLRKADGPPDWAKSSSEGVASPRRGKT